MTAAPDSRPPARRAWRRWVAAAAVALVVGALAFARSLDDTLHAHAPSHLLLDRQGRPLGELPSSSDDAYGYWPLPDVLPEKLVVATLETEDRHYDEHDGVHWPSVLRAAWQNARSRRVISGASTIPMQVARLQHPKARSLWAKVREAAEALLLIRRHGHDAVLRQYLTIAPYGNRAHGIVRAARLYFDKPVEDLSWLEAAFLAALPQQPGRMSPWTEQGRARAQRRAQRILSRLHARGILDDEALHVAQHAKLVFAPRPTRPGHAMHAVLALGRDAQARPGFLHRATLDLDVQRLAAQALEENLLRLRPLGAGASAAVAVELERGELLAYVGSTDYFDEEHKGAIDYLTARRSPGSALKPFIYALALEDGTHTAATELPDTPVEFVVPGGGLYVPENMTHTFLGPMLLRQALGNSRNIPALRVLSDVGVDRVVALLERGGVAKVRYRPEAYGLTLAIGSLHVTPLELAQLYTALANQGVTLPARRFVDDPVEPGRRLFLRDPALLTSQILADPEARRPGFAAGGPMDFDFAAAVKTGTSQGYRDAWAVAYTQRHLVVVWVGNHDWRRMNLASGVTAAAPAAHAILERLTALDAAHPPALELPLPPSVVHRDVCTISGKLPGPACPHTKAEVFLPGTEPVEPCRYHGAVALDVRTGLRATPSCPKDVVVSQPMLALPDTYAVWARRKHLPLAPTAESPLCPSAPLGPPTLKIREPLPASRYLYDPDTPREFATVRLAASVEPATEDVVWLVDGTPVGTVGYPHELRWPMTPGVHTIRAQLAHSAAQSPPVRIVVDD